MFKKVEDVLRLQLAVSAHRLIELMTSSISRVIILAGPGFRRGMIGVVFPVKGSRR